ncbi:hypothetical protein [Mycolicibacter arupensis]|jgi:hypothetical protein|uniref:Uncharacterized protein n=1 Tax=Mycolicibacter arupensis TaxID=342002 RepID=A0A5C7Y414_9MYCO|nr:hypothetical protein [Mycolicibacter arupensis]TXI56665.1 MAG: hypothetical protein E6Q54_09885 [Mycolicibacter arupensis]
MGELAEQQGRLKAIYNAHGDSLKRDLGQQSQYLVGKAGDADRQSLTAQMRYAYAAADHFESKVTTALGFQSVLVDIKSSLSLTHEAALEEWKQTGGGGSDQMSMAALAAVAAKYGPEVTSAHETAMAEYERTSKPKPVPTYGGQKHGDGTQALDNRTDHQDHSGQKKPAPSLGDHKLVGEPSPNGGTDKSPEVKDGAGGDHIGDHTWAPGQLVDRSDPGSAEAAKSAGIGDSASTQIVAPAGALPFKPASPGGGSSGSSGGGMGSQAASLPGSLGSALSSGGGMGSPASATSSLPGSLGSAFSGGGLGSPTAAASALPGSPLPDMSSALSSGQSSFSPLSNAGSSFQSGLASGLGSSGALQPMAPVQPAVSAVQSMAAPVMPAAAPSEAGGLAGGGPMMGGGGAVPPAAMAGGGGATGSLAPYAPAGSGAVPPPAAAAATTAAAGSAAGGPASGGPVQQGAGGGGVPMVASAAGGAVGAVPEPDANADLVAAKQVLAGLIRGSDGALEVPLWAVSVLRTPTGPQTVVASNVGGGSWVPATVFLPWTARLATVDPTLPMGWAASFMGWRKPVDIVLAHCDEVSKTAAGVSTSAIATSDPTASIPGWIDSATIGLREVWATPGVTPALGGAHVHRLVAIDPRLAMEVARLEDRGEVSVWAASQLCAAIVRAAEAENPVAGISLVSRDDVATLVAVSDGGVDWDAYDERVREERGGVLWPVGPEDLDDSATTQTMRNLYRQRFRAGRIIELVRLWREGPPRIRDVVYCGIMAGQGAAVAEELQTINTALGPRA